ncbi:MAG: LptF/LptG family permease [Acidobacteriota bacterium]|nr:LptF/LptG family permease [Blastocatellia bacterium]MDW8412038.1 LptF/LptG family permease [Acidobacteriota bacterium]
MIIHRYLLKEIIPYFLLSLFLLTAIVFIHEANRFSDLFVLFSRRGLEAWPLVKLMLSLLPGILLFTLPISLLFGILIALGRLGSDSELIVLSACGISRRRILLSPLLLALLVTGIAFYNTATLLPTAVSSVQSLKKTRSRLIFESLLNQIRPGVFEEGLPGKVFLIREIDRETRLWKQIFVAEEIDPELEPRIFTALSGELIIGDQLERSELHLYDGFIYDAYARKRREHNRASTSSFKETTIRFDLSAGAVTPEEETFKPETATLEELLQRPIPTARADALRLKTEIHKRLALPFSCPLFATFAVMLSLSVHRGSRSFGLLVGILITMTYYLLVVLGEDLSRQGLLPAYIGMWLPNAVMAVLLLAVTLRYRWFRAVTEKLSIMLKYLKPFLPLQTARPTLQQFRFKFSFPRTIDRMILSELSRYFLITLSGLSTVFIVFTLFALTDDIVENKVRTGRVLTYLLFLLPQVIHYTAPFALLISVLVTFGTFGKTSQLIALHASGQSLYRLSLPVLFYAAMLATLLYLSQEYVLPFSNQRQDYLRALIKGKKVPPQTFYQGNRKWFLGQDNKLIHFQHFDYEKTRMVGLAIYELVEDGKGLRRRISANEAVWNSSSEEWVLRAGFQRTFDGPEVKLAERFKELRLRLPERPEYFKQSLPESSKMSIRQLIEQIERLQASGIDVLNLRIALQAKLASPLTCLVMAILGLPFATTFGKRGALAGIGVGIFLAVGFWAALEMFLQLGRYELLSPAMSSWGPNMLFSAGGFYLLFTAKT